MKNNIDSEPGVYDQPEVRLAEYEAYMIKRHMDDYAKIRDERLSAIDELAQLNSMSPEEIAAYDEEALINAVDRLRKQPDYIESKSDRHPTDEELVQFDPWYQNNIHKARVRYLEGRIVNFGQSARRSRERAEELLDSDPSPKKASIKD